MQNQSNNRISIVSRLLRNPRQDTALVSVALGAVALLAVIAALGLGASQQAQLGATAQSVGDAGRVVVQLQRETLRLLALVRQDPESLDDKAVELQIALLKSRFGIVSQPLIRSSIPPSIVTALDQIQANWTDMQPLVTQWQANPKDRDTQAKLAERLAAMEIDINTAEINFQRERISALDQLYQTSQRWFLVLGSAALLVILFVVAVSLNLYRAGQQRQAAELAQAAAIESNRLKSEFLATMSHELRTPLNAVIGYADFLLSALGDNFSEKQSDYLKRILANGERLLRLVDEILDISRIEAGRVDLINAPFTPGDLMDRVKPELQRLATKKGLDLRATVDPKLPEPMMGDRDRLAQIVLNLAGNAIKFTETGHVDVSLAHSDQPGRWTITVTDTGVGIPLHAQEFIFDKFRQVDGSTERQQGGVGLGLAIVRNLALLMGGTVAVQSKTGQGSSFVVDLPIVALERVKVAES